MLNTSQGMGTEREQHTNGTHKHIKGPALDVRCASKIDQLDPSLPVQNDVLVLDVAVDDQRLGVKMVNGARDLDENAAAFLLLHVGAKLDVVEEIHAG